MIVYTIIVTYCGERWINKTIESVRLSSITTNIIVVDNASTDNTLKILQSLKLSIHIEALNRNIGFGKANNIGISIALSNNADYVFLLNQDAYLKPDTIQKLIEAYEKMSSTKFGVISPIHLNGNGMRFDYGFFKNITTGGGMDFFEDLYFNRALATLYEVNFVNAACWLIPKATLLKIGGFDPLFHHYGEDRNYLNRLHFHGLRVGICPQAEILHDRDQTYSINQTIRNSSRKLLIQKFTNPLNNNANIELRRTIIYSFLAFLKSIMFFKKDIKKQLVELIFLIKNRRTINNHWHKNRTLGSHYLNGNS